MMYLDYIIYYDMNCGYFNNKCLDVISINYEIVRTENYITRFMRLGKVKIVLYGNPKTKRIEHTLPIRIDKSYVKELLESLNELSYNSLVSIVKTVEALDLLQTIFR